MPVKYLAGFPLAVRVAASVHGALFLLFLVSLYRLTAFESSILLFGTFVLDASLRP
jgi:integral membrane protein